MTEIEKAFAKEKEEIKKAREKRKAAVKIAQEKEAKKFAKIDQKIGALFRKNGIEIRDFAALAEYLKKYKFAIENTQKKPMEEMPPDQGF